MTSCTIIISHYEAKCFLDAAIRQMRKLVHPKIEQKIIICDQSSEETLDKIVKQYCGEEDIAVAPLQPFYSGYNLDWLLRYWKIETDYIAQFHADAMPIHQNYLYLPIKLIEENNFAFVGQLQTISDGTPSIYPPHPFFAMAQCFNVARTQTYKELSTEAGFTRFHERAKTEFAYKNNDWAAWASEDYWSRGSDDDIVAFAWQDKYKEVSKLGLAISGYIEPCFGRLIDDLVFHFGSANEAKSLMDTMPEGYRHYTKRILENYDDALIEEMVNLAKQNKPPELEILTRNIWNGTFKKSFPSSPELDKRIEELKHG